MAQFVFQDPFVWLIADIFKILLVGCCLVMMIPGVAPLINAVFVALWGVFYGPIDTIPLIVPSFLRRINATYYIVYRGLSKSNDYRPGMVDCSVFTAQAHCCFSTLRLSMSTIGFWARLCGYTTTDVT